MSNETRDMIENVWEEFEYYVHVYRVGSKGYIEYLYCNTLGVKI